MLNGPTEFGPTYPSSTLFTTDSKRECQAGDIIFCVRGNTTGRMNWADRKYSLGRGVCSIRGETPLDTRYLRYCVEISLPEMLQHAVGSTMPNLTQTAIRQFPVPYSPHRKKIASILSAYDDLIENNNRRIKILEELARLIYREWFVHFRFPGHEKVRMVESELGLIPEGWSSTSLEMLMDFQGGAQPPKSEWIKKPRDGFVRMIQIRDYETEVHMGFVKDSRRLRKCRETDIMIARYGASVGRICWGLAGAYNVALVRVLPHQDHYKEFLRSFLSLDTFQRLLIGMSGRTAQAGFSKGVLSAITLAIPLESSLFQRYESFARPLRQMTLCLRRTNRNLRQTRDLLLPRLVSGELDVSDLDIEVPSGSQGTVKLTHCRVTWA